MLAQGSIAPDFSLESNHGYSIRLSDFRGQKRVVLYFYPKDDTSGCTVEAQGFSAKKADFDALETVILGVSKDTTKSHQKFCSSYGLTITLLADPDRQVIERYGVWQLKKFMGREFMGVVRTTFLIDKDGIIQAVWPKVTPVGHEEEVLEAVKNLP